MAESNADASRVLTNRLGESRPILGNPEIKSRIGESAFPDAVLARTNLSTIKAVVEALKERKLPHLAGGPGDLIRLIEGVVDLKAGRPSTIPEFFGFTSWTEFVESTEEEGSRMHPFVKFIEEQKDERRIIQALKNTVEKKDANVVISTAHKAKGGEWGSVRLLDDFSTKSDPAEMRLLYVAVTRAQKQLDVPEAVLSFIKDEK
jgi:superfamily I DNA/RNA helicase